MSVQEHHDSKQHTMAVVCRRTGLKSDRLRGWERRYGVVSPARSDGNQRLYSDEDIAKLALLSRATRAGHRISHIASLSVEELDALLAADESAAAAAPRGSASVTEPVDPAQALGACVAAIQQFDAERLREEIRRCASSLTGSEVIREVLVPLIHQIGDLWREGGLTAAHEHLGTAVVRAFLQALHDSYEAPATAPTIVISTPAGERHELGALLAVATAAAHGWNTVYLGPDLPAAEIAAAARQRGARAVGLSVVYPEDGGVAAGELATLRRHLPADTAVLVGGRAAQSLRPTADVDAVFVEDLDQLVATLDELRSVA